MRMPPTKPRAAKPVAQSNRQGGGGRRHRADGRGLLGFEEKLHRMGGGRRICKPCFITEMRGQDRLEALFVVLDRNLRDAELM